MEGKTRCVLLDCNTQFGAPAVYYMQFNAQICQIEGVDNQKQNEIIQHTYEYKCATCMQDTHCYVICPNSKCENCENYGHIHLVCPALPSKKYMLKFLKNSVLIPDKKERLKNFINLLLTVRDKQLIYKHAVEYYKNQVVSEKADLYARLFSNHYSDLDDINMLREYKIKFILSFVNNYVKANGNPYMEELRTINYKQPEVQRFITDVANSLEKKFDTVKLVKSAKFHITDIINHTNYTDKIASLYIKYFATVFAKLVVRNIYNLQYCSIADYDNTVKILYKIYKVVLYHSNMIYHQFDRAICSIREKNQETQEESDWDLI